MSLGSKQSGQVKPALHDQLSVLECQVKSSHEVRAHLERLLQVVTSDLERSDGSRASLMSIKQHLSDQNADLQKLLKQETLQRQEAEKWHVDGSQRMWQTFHSMLDQERAAYEQLSSSKQQVVCRACYESP